MVGWERVAALGALGGKDVRGREEAVERMEEWGAVALERLRGECESLPDADKRRMVKVAVALVPGEGEGVALDVCRRLKGWMGDGTHRELVVRLFSMLQAGGRTGQREVAFRDLVGGGAAAGAFEGCLEVANARSDEAVRLIKEIEYDAGSVLRRVEGSTPEDVVKGCRVAVAFDDAKAAQVAGESQRIAKDEHKLVTIFS